MECGFWICGILPVLSFCVERSFIIDRAQRFRQSEIRNPKSEIRNPRFTSRQLPVGTKGWLTIG
ncbi:hypothetical protein D1AOALGA4SA_6341 [Olavius algarvensis Delta 1 endosymbiont]|nr:hypothetical protein D1AOALGA4SA_6341 [Olavius algarvensis Delta 1 endosymbiont]